jgi:peptide-methionine (S)-S-oxide reductase
VNTQPTHEVATLAGGCFWCLEAVYTRVKGVISVVSGYTGGEIANPNYYQVCSGTTGHAESVQITFDPAIISFEKILNIFWEIHNPTTLNKQGNDVGTEYRSAIFYHNAAQQKAAEQSMKGLAATKRYSDAIVTELVPATEFYPAEQNHQNYYDSNRNNAYCRIIIDPKVKKLLEGFPDVTREV